MFRSVSFFFTYSWRIAGILVHSSQMKTFSEPTTYGAEGRIVKPGELDPEAQQFSSELKHYPS